MDWLFTPTTLAARDANGDTPLHHAAKRNLAQAVEFLAQKGAALDAANAAGETALHQAVKADAADAARALLALGASLSARDAMGDTPLHAAVLWAAKQEPAHPRSGRGRPQRPRLRRRDAPPSGGAQARPRLARVPPLQGRRSRRARQPRGRRLSPWPSSPAAYDIERDLLAADAEVDARDQAGRTALIEAASQGDADSTRILVAAGADIMARDADGDSPLTIAIKRNPALLKIHPRPGRHQSRRPRRQDAAAPHSRDPSPPPTSWAWPIATGAKLDARDRFAATSLHAALRAGDKDTAARLAKAGADVFARDKDGETPASLAMAAGVDTLKALVTAAGIAAKDKQGNGWLHYAAIAANARRGDLAPRGGGGQDGQEHLGRDRLRRRPEARQGRPGGHAQAGKLRAGKRRMRLPLLRNRPGTRKAPSAP